MELALKAGKARIEASFSKTFSFVALGRLEIVLERSFYRPAKGIEVCKDYHGFTAAGGYNSPRFFALGWCLFWSRLA